MAPKPAARTGSDWMKSVGIRPGTRMPAYWPTTKSFTRIWGASLSRIGAIRDY